MRILFISRAYPPTVGGIENQNYELSVWLSKIAEVKTIVNKRGKIFLPLFLPYALIRALVLFRKYDALLLGDGVLGIVGWFVKLFYRKPVISVIHGLDLTYKMPLYQKLWVNFFIKKLYKLIAVGNETVKIGVAKGIPADIMYVIAGDGSDRENIKIATEKNNLKDRVKILGYVADEIRNILFNTCDLFVQPNVKIEGDVEGFGISVLEAASCKLPVIASNLEGLKDAIKDGQNGFLVESGNAEAWIQKINELLSDDNFRKDFGEKARQFTIENYSWEKIAKKYSEEIRKVTSNFLTNKKNSL